MTTLVQLLPMRALFVVVFAILPIVFTIYDRGVGDITALEWVSFVTITVGAVLVYAVSDMMTSVDMQTYLWPLLGIMGLGLLIYRTILVERGEFQEASIERGGTSYDD